MRNRAAGDVIARRYNRRIDLAEVSPDSNVGLGWIRNKPRRATDAIPATFRDTPVHILHSALAPSFGDAVNSDGQATSRLPVITMDGPVGAGKTTVAELISSALDFLFVDTGLFYRSVAWLMLQRGLDPADEPAAAEVARNLDLGLEKILPGAARQSVAINGIDATDDLYSPEVENAVSIVARNPQVRAALLPKQRAMLQSGGVVVAGRDIGTVVWPSAELKVYVDATVIERARRKYDERLEIDGSADYDEILTLLQKRDRIDSARKVSPLRIPDDAEYIDTNDISAEQVAEIIIQSLARKVGFAPANSLGRD
jgi:cytidylate kinase